MSDTSMTSTLDVCKVILFIVTLPSLSAQRTNFSVVGWPFLKLVASSRLELQQQLHGSFETALLEFLSTGVGVKL
jgi:hypothetical protein